MKFTLALALGLAGLTLAAASPQRNGDFLRGVGDFFTGRGRRGRQQGGRGNSGGGGGKCSGRGKRTNYNSNSGSYLVSWKIGCTSFKQGEADRFCRDAGMRPISIDSREKEDEFLRLVRTDRQRYFWTGGQVSGRNIRWPSGKRYNSVNWSNTGG